MTIFETLNSVNVNNHTEKKNGLTYLSWAWAWAEVKKVVPSATYTIYERETDYGPVNYFTDGRTCWVKTGVTLDGLEHIEELPVMDFKNRSIPLEQVTSMDVNKAIQRSLTKACARHGLGLYIYAGEDLPEGDEQPEDAQKPGEKADLPKAGAWNPRTAISAWCARMGITQEAFVKLRSALVEAKIVPDIKAAAMTPIDFDNLCKAMQSNYGDMLKVTA